MSEPKYDVRTEVLAFAFLVALIVVTAILEHALR